ncbi:hypothetical protein predicted by Glimmer/Critica [Secundilactobacillus pentosiphilus]|uniref:HipA-like kinase domain-containing protein n=1 Tax=Secundilactobacillus pentosiphilus TaxID=1714682 RepID=A0A1Z5IZW8_9LACO|nr:HipA family kinase [Secundilactobacillus pentosiphilus]GAX07186.1 hypothetical protein predicted by Glimmer/Critica [Secundilactobacillus pentosiphilus]
MTLLEIDTIIHQMKAGNSQPFLVSCNDSKQYVMKCLNNTTNGKALFNELIAYRLSNLLKIDSPKSGIAKLPKNIVESNTLLLNNESRYGKCFVSQLINGVSLGINPITVSSISNINIFPKLVFFDTFLMNSDRADNKGNWFITKKDKKLIALDHTNIFRIAQIWDSASLAQDSQNPPEIIKQIDDLSYRLLAERYKKNNPQTHHPFSPIARIFKNLSDKEIHSCFSKIPSEWKISDTDLQAAQNFILFQREHSTDIVNELDQKFGFNKGGYQHGKF